MKMLLQNTRNKRYFCLPGGWSEDPEAAFDFQHSRRALEFVRKQDLKEVHLVAKFEHPHWEQIVPMPMLVATLSLPMAA